jgi:hypothetical protein
MISVAGLKYPGALAITPSRPRPPSAGRLVTPNVPRPMAVSRPSSPIRDSSPTASPSTSWARRAMKPPGSGRKLPARPPAARRT